MLGAPSFVDFALLRSVCQLQGLSAAEQQRRKKDRQLEDLQAALENEVYKLTRLEEIQSELTTGFPAARAKAESGGQRLHSAPWKKVALLQNGLEARLCHADMAGAVQKLISIAGDQLASWQDNLYSATVTDEHIFRYLFCTVHQKSNEESQVTREYVHHGVPLH